MQVLIALLLACGTTDSNPVSDTPPEAERRPTRSSPHAPPASLSLEVTDLRVRAMPPGSPNTAAFLTLTNPADQPVRLVGARSSAARTVELHAHVEEGGVMRMRPIDEIVVPAGDSVTLKPGGLHIMLIGVHDALEEGTIVPIALRFADGGTRDEEAPVVGIRPSGG